MSPFGVLTTLLRGASRRALDSKHGPIGYYKGKGVRPLGRHTRKGGYVMDPEKMIDLVVPDLTGFQLKPYVSHKTPKVKVGAVTAETFLKSLSAPADSAVGSAATKA